MRCLLLAGAVVAAIASPGLAQTVEAPSAPVVIGEAPLNDRISTQGIGRRDNVWVLAGSAALVALAIALVADSDTD